jgi:hypothetical protein
MAAEVSLAEALRWNCFQTTPQWHDPTRMVRIAGPGEG